ncbi:MAG TPA: hypothetical protein VEK57_29595 [Thermoanaerobaculia bacterium]|nr:hypothetical protein [Thermoanaerobaculia bacterium]
MAGGTKSNLFNTGIDLIFVSFNRGPFLKISGIVPPDYAAEQALHAPGWDLGGPSPGNVGPGRNFIQVKTGGLVLPQLILKLPEVEPIAIQTYLFQVIEPGTLTAEFLCMVLSGGQILGVNKVKGFATPEIA